MRSSVADDLAALDVLRAHIENRIQVEPDNGDLRRQLEQVRRQMSHATEEAESMKEGVGMPSTTSKSEQLEREMERAERFRRIASHRANKALGYIEALLRTADRSRYLYSEKQTTEVVTKLRQAIDQLEAAYSGGGAAKLRVDL